MKMKFLYLETSEKDEESYSSEDEEVIFSIITTILIRFYKPGCE